MSAIVVSPTPTLPPVRRPSVWEKMAGTLKIKKHDDYEDHDVSPLYSPLAQSNAASGIERSTLKVQRRNGSVIRKASVAASSIASSKSRSGSLASSTSRRPSKWWRSSNPENDDLPPVPSIDTKFSSMFGSHNPDINCISPVSPIASRKPSYVPRSAASSFLRTTTPANKCTQDVLNHVTSQLVVEDLTHLQAPLKPIQIKTVELRKDSYANPENHGLFSMFGVCEITEEVEEPLDEEAVSPTNNRNPESLDQLFKECIVTEKRSPVSSISDQSDYGSESEPSDSVHNVPV